jgi:hypothetical protein
VLQEPDQNWKLVQKCLEEKTPPEDPDLLEVYNHLAGIEESSRVGYVLRKWREPDYRDVLVAFFLSGATPEFVANVFECNEKPIVEALGLFEKLFIDMTVFDDRLEQLCYCDYYLENLCDKTMEKNQAIVREAVKHGHRTLASWFCRGSFEHQLKREEIADSLLLIAYTQALAGRDAPILSNVAKEAHKWVKTTIDVVNFKEEKKSSDTVMSALLAIAETRGPNRLLESGVKPEDILHGDVDNVGT